MPMQIIQDWSTQYIKTHCRGNPCYDHARSQIFRVSKTV
jgi:hypothetical protein